jgi:hypothetical protein
MTEDRLLIEELAAKGGQPDFLRTIAENVLQLIMEADVDGLIGAGRHERSSERATWRNGYRDRSLDTRVGTLNLKIPKLRAGSYFPGFLEPRKMVEKALVAVIQEAWIGGVSTRRVDELVQAMGMTGISKSTVSKLCKDIDERVHAFLKRPLTGEWPYLWLDATYLKGGCRTPASSGCRSSSLSAFAAWFGMNDIASTAKASFAEQSVIFKRKHNWIMCWLYTGTFGSFIGFSAASRCCQDAVPGHQRPADTPSSGRWSARCRAPSPAGSPTASAAGASPSGYSSSMMRWAWLGSSTSSAMKGEPGAFAGLLRHASSALLRERRRQRFDLPDDPGDHAARNGARWSGG